jgi:probable HAF family extracellular repeat protein
VNDVGNTILWGSPSGFNRNHAAFWDGDAASPVIDLGTFGGTESWAWGLNNLGHVVGYAEEPNGIYKGFFWDGDTMLKLDTLGGPASSAFAINDEGVITGWAQDPVGVTHAVLWVPTGAPGDPGDGVPDATGTLFLVGPMFGLLAWFGAAGRRRRTKPDMSPCAKTNCYPRG